MRRYFDKTVAIPAIHPELRHVNIVRERYWLDRLVTDARLFRRHLVPGCACQAAGEHDRTDRHFQRQPVRPAWEKVRHTLRGRARVQATASSETGPSKIQTVKLSDGARVKGCTRPRGSQDCINACAERKTKFVKSSYREKRQPAALFR